MSTVVTLAVTPSTVSRTLPDTAPAGATTVTTYRVPVPTERLISSLVRLTVDVPALAPSTSSHGTVIVMALGRVDAARPNPRV